MALFELMVINRIGGIGYLSKGVQNITELKKRML